MALPAETTHVAVGIPAWQASQFIGETLTALASQTHQDWSATISVDADDTATVDACAPFLADPRFRLVVQPRRLGWVANCNAVLAASLGRGAYAMILPHDDLPAPTYLATLIAHAEAYPEAACVYSDITVEGRLTFVQPSICGPPIARQLTLLTGHRAAVAFRGLLRQRALLAAGGLRGNEADDFVADTVWMARLARAGELHRVPQALYDKRFHDGNTHTTWERWPSDRQRRAWLVHCRDLLEEALVCADDAAARWALLAATVARLLGVFPATFPLAWHGALEPADRLSYATELLSAVWSRGTLGSALGIGPEAAAQLLVMPRDWEAILAQRIADATASHDAASAHLTSTLAERDQEIERLSAALAEQEHTIAQVTSHLAGITSTLSRLEAHMREEEARLRDTLNANTRLVEQQAQLSAALTTSEADRQRLLADVEQLRASTSWRITTPLRAVGARLRR